MSAGWDDGQLRSPASGAPLAWDTPHSMTDGAIRYPVIDGIPYLRAGHEASRVAALHHLDGKDRDRALCVLLAERDDWAPGEGPRDSDLLAAVRAPDLTLGAAMTLFSYGRVADYFAYRWSDPTYLSGLQLLQLATLGEGLPLLEIACGVGHYLREASRRGIEAIGVDVVFSKLWLARRFVAEEARLVCADVAAGLPLPDQLAGTVFCHDAFYFLEDKQRVVEEMSRVSRGSVVIGHAHNREADNLSPGEPWSVAEYAAVLPRARLFDDQELTLAFLEARAPVSRTAEQLRCCAAVSMIQRDMLDVAVTPAARVDFASPQPGERWQLNPLLDDGSGVALVTPRWPSPRYAEEYGPTSGYLHLREGDYPQALQELQAFRERAPLSPRLADLVRRRIFLQLPPQW